MSNKLQFVAPFGHYLSVAKPQQTKVCWTFFSTLIDKTFLTH